MEDQGQGISVSNYHYDANNCSVHAMGDYVTDAMKNEVEAMIIFLEKKDAKPSLMKKILGQYHEYDTHMLRELVERKTRYGGTLFQCISTGVVIPSSTVGAYACDEHAYEVFKELFHELIRECHEVKPNTEHQTAERDTETTPAENDIWNVSSEYIKSSRVRMARNVSGYAFSSTIQSKDRLRLEEDIIESLKALQARLGGRYYSLCSISEDDVARLTEKHILFTNNNKYQESAGTYREWPEGRGLYVSDDARCVVWVNEEDHIRCMSTQPGPHLSEAFNMVTQTLKVLQQKLRLSHDDKLGYLTCCPTNVGTCLRASVHIRLVHVPKLDHFLKIISTLNLQMRGTGGEDTDVVDNIYDISNKRRFGLTEKAALMDLQKGVEILSLLEKSLEPGNNITKL